MKTAGGKNKAGIEAAAVGTRQPRLDGPEKVSGRAIFTDDVRPAGMLHGKILRSKHKHARILSIDTAKAEALPGVKAIVLAEDAKGIYAGQNEPAICGTLYWRRAGRCGCYR